VINADATDNPHPQQMLGQLQQSLEI